MAKGRRRSAAGSTAAAVAADVAVVAAGAVDAAAASVALEPFSSAGGRASGMMSKLPSLIHIFFLFRRLYLKK
jgi:hypothetical protein